ncbi:hypothetical protein GALLN_00064 [Gallionellaceae bacterium]|nr:hypothetical protein GALLN_00064 [Gallionellaceae bacterium]
MKVPNPEAEKVVDKRRKVQKIGDLRREKMIVIRVGERRVPGENQPDHPDPTTKK